MYRVVNTITGHTVWSSRLEWQALELADSNIAYKMVAMLPVAKLTTLSQRLDMLKFSAASTALIERAEMASITRRLTSRIAS